MNRRGPAAFLIGAALFWLAAGLAFSAAAAAALAWPVSGRFCAGALARCAPAGEMALRFGWASLAGTGLGLGILHGRPVTSGRFFWIGGILWNGTLLWGMGGVLLGKETDWPAGLALAALLFGVGAWRLPRPAVSSLAENYALAAFTALPVCFCGRLVWGPASGLAAVIGTCWSDGAFCGLWLAPLALAVLYSTWPKEGAVIPHAGPAALGFLVQFGAAGWTGTARLVGGPVPLWIGSLGTAASLLMLLPALAVPLSLAEAGPVVWTGPRRVLAAACAAYVLFLTQGAALALRAASPWHLTFCDAAQADLGLFGFVSLAFAAGLGRFSGGAAWGGVTGVALFLGAEEMAGWLQAFVQMDPHVPWTALTALLHPFLVLRAAGLVLMLAAAVSSFFRRTP